MSRYVGVDLHRRRSRVAILEEDGVKVSSVKVDNGDATVFTDAERMEGWIVAKRGS